MNQTQKNILDILAKKAIDLDWHIAFGGKSKGNRHLFRVNKIATVLQRKEGGDKFIVLSAAWTHDVALAFGDDNNLQEIYKHTFNFLVKNGVGPSSQLIAEAAAGHEESMSSSIEAKIVHDADVLDKSGVLGIIRHIWKMSNLIEDRIVNSESDLILLRESLEKRQKKLFTATGRKLFKDIEQDQLAFFEKQNALEMMSSISLQARKGIISDHIAQQIILEFPKSKIAQSLQTQLQCTYL